MFIFMNKWNKNNFPFPTLISFSSLKKRDAKKKVTTDGDEAEKSEKIKTDDNDLKSDAENESDKKKTTKKSADSVGIENDENKECGSVDAAEVDATAEEAETDELQVGKSSDAEDDESDKKGDDKEKRKKFVRLFCMHCRIESATFKVMANSIKL